MNKNPLIWIIILAVVLAGLYGAYRVYKHFSRPSSSVEQNQIESQTPSASTSGTIQEGSPTASASEHLVTITSAGFSPSVITIKSGEIVTWMNNDTAPHTVNSDPHPTHTLYPILNTVGRIDPGAKKSLTFQPPGSYKYHDHLNPTLTGQVVAQ